ncbi:hypothetical protein BDV95DRAFT_93860 [Massariosphaeria phaeospora]|uniref:GST N-terminal domain-containing protein n=1 Tax=Massariosphaeria phaeospora TaxID=100035 RepID=A0A7C8I3K0_9PLEO|nr:hypothetical protein BDV95DRAFT_93860 [Massariosphaeria phaeospora]
MPPVVLYDIPTKAPPKAWSLNPWKNRMVLNYKGIDYRTEWVEYPDVRPTLKSFGLLPNDPNGPGYYTEYTIPAIRYEDGTYSMESWKIVQELEKQYPTPSLHLDDPITVQVRDRISSILDPIRGVLIPRMPRGLLSEPSGEYIVRTREKQFGMPLEQVEKELGGEQAWKEVEQPAKEVAELLKKNGGPFFLGKTISYADMILASYLHFLKCVGGEDNFERFVALDSAFVALYDASKELLAKDD